MPDLTVEYNVLRDFDAASSREWLVTNGIGGYAAGSLSGANTRGYHGLLVAATTPPTGRRVVLSKLEETVTMSGETFELSANVYPGAVHPNGYQFLHSFEGYPAPRFVYSLPTGALLTKTIWMLRGSNVTYVKYELEQAKGPVQLRLSPLVCWKDFHGEMRERPDYPFDVALSCSEVRIVAEPGGAPLRLLAPMSGWQPADYWHRNILHPREQERGLGFVEDLYCPGHMDFMLAAGEAATVTAAFGDVPEEPQSAWNELCARQARLIQAAEARGSVEEALTISADSFIVESCGDHQLRSSVLAGYPWFSDWGRDTMISLPGLCLATGRADTARRILLEYAKHISQGMIPNRFPDEGVEAEYNTVDATLWYIHAIDQYEMQRGSSPSIIVELWSSILDILDWHTKGTRFGIAVDPSDGLLAAGESGVQLTWMDARVGEWVVTPRMGKPVEINALWYNALRIAAKWAEAQGVSASQFVDQAARVRKSFQEKFVRLDGEGLYDVLTSSGPDASIRPNQIFAASLPHSPLTSAQRSMVVAAVRRHLLTPYGLRTLSPADPAFRGRFEGAPVDRDAAYHQGTAWPWLLGAYIEAYLRQGGNPKEAARLLQPLGEHLLDAGIGQVSEVFDGSEPHRPGGCIAQAWSTAELLRALRLVQVGAPG